MNSAVLIYPHQLYNEHPFLRDAGTVFLVEDPLFFKQYRFHFNKLVLHRASLQSYAEQLKESGREARTISCQQIDDSEEIGEILREAGVSHVRFVELNDDWLEQRVKRGLERCGIRWAQDSDPGFLVNSRDFELYRSERLSQAEFYKSQRRKLNMLLVKDGTPQGGSWSFDKENRKALPRGLTLPATPRFGRRTKVEEAKGYIRARFPEALGIDEADDFNYPICREEAKFWLDRFISDRFELFGDYEDAIAKDQDVLFHSVLSPSLNLGIITPADILSSVTAAKEIRLNSKEGFVRQVIGWREYVRLAYSLIGRIQRSTNFLNFHRPIPQSFYDGTTGIEPVDNTIKKVLRTGYCHHIERLMILGNFMMLCEINPSCVYQWFMEMFIDSYDWVMVPNVYGMSQFADGGLITTKPYLSGANYILKMSDYQKGPWCDIWTALYWRFLYTHRHKIQSIPRISPLLRNFESMGSKLNHHLQLASDFLSNLHY